MTLNHYLNSFKQKDHLLSFSMKNCKHYLLFRNNLYIQSEVLDENTTPRKSMALDLNNKKCFICYLTSVNIQFGGKKGHK